MMNKQTMNIEVYVEPNWHESLFVSLNENKKSHLQPFVEIKTKSTYYFIE